MKSSRVKKKYPVKVEEKVHCDCIASEVYGKKAKKETIRLCRSWLCRSVRKVSYLLTTVFFLYPIFVGLVGEQELLEGTGKTVHEKLGESHLGSVNHGQHCDNYVSVLSNSKWMSGESQLTAQLLIVAGNWVWYPDIEQQTKPEGVGPTSRRPCDIASQQFTTQAAMPHTPSIHTEVHHHPHTTGSFLGLTSFTRRCKILTNNKLPATG